MDLSRLNVSDEVLMAICEDIKCASFNDRGYFKELGQNASVDSFISNRTCGIHGEAKVVQGSCLSPDAQFVMCSDQKGHIDTFYEVTVGYNLPPNLIAEACRFNGGCVGFMVTNDRRWGYLLRHANTSGVSRVYTRLSVLTDISGWQEKIKPDYSEEKIKQDYADLKKFGIDWAV